MGALAEARRAGRLSLAIGGRVPSRVCRDKMPVVQEMSAQFAPAALAQPPRAMPLNQSHTLVGPVATSDWGFTAHGFLLLRGDRKCGN